MYPHEWQLMLRIPWTCFIELCTHIGSTDYDDDFMDRVMKNYDPPDLWISTPSDQFPDPKLDVDGFMRYCGESYNQLTAYLWLVTREMIESGVEIKPIAKHEPFIFSELCINVFHMIASVYVKYVYM